MGLRIEGSRRSDFLGVRVASGPLPGVLDV